MTLSGCAVIQCNSSVTRHKVKKAKNQRLHKVAVQSSGGWGLPGGGSGFVFVQGHLPIDSGCKKQLPSLTAGPPLPHCGRNKEEAEWSVTPE